jgi:DNA-binding transcriptional ArsR family regulator
MSDDIPSEELGNDIRRSIFSALLASETPMTPSEIGDGIGETRQQVKYHLDKLLRMGLVISDDGEYTVQPIFTDTDYQRAVSTSLSTLVPYAQSMVELDETLDPEDRDTVVSNCLRLSIAMHIRE